MSWSTLKNYGRLQIDHVAGYSQRKGCAEIEHQHFALTF